MTSTSIRNFPATFADLDRFMGPYTHKTLCNNTIAEKSLDYGDVESDPERTGQRCFRISLHGHHIATLWEDGAVFVRDAGWQTVITKQRLNHILDANRSCLRLTQRSFRWYLYNWKLQPSEYRWIGELYQSVDELAAPCLGSAS